MASQFTKHDKRWYIFFFIISLMLNVVPELVAAILIFTNKESQGRVTPLIICIVVALILMLINLIAKTRIRSAAWIVFFGLYYALMNVPEYLTYTLLAIGICIVIDDLIVTPLYRHFKFKWKSNKVIDTRLEAMEREKVK